MDPSNGGMYDSPIKGPTLSTSTSSFEGLDAYDPNLSELATTFFAKTEAYLSGEFATTYDHYKKIEIVNRAALTKYSQFRKTTENLLTKIDAQDQVYESLLPQLLKVDEIERCVTELEKMAKVIDAYSKRLEAKYNQVQ